MPILRYPPVSRTYGEIVDVCRCSMGKVTGCSLILTQILSMSRIRSSDMFVSLGNTQSFLMDESNTILGRSFRAVGVLDIMMRLPTELSTIVLTLLKNTIGF